MRIARFTLALVFCLCVLLGRPGDAALGLSGQDGELVKMVILSRHGVRSPTQSAKVLDLWSQKPWPAWPVESGWLTPRGAGLVSAMWANLRQTFNKLGASPESGVPSIHVRADSDERTVATARALLNGFAPDSGIAFEVADVKVDPLFHPVKAGLYRYDAIRVACDILSMTRDGLGGLQDQFSGVMESLDQIVGSPAPSLCSRFALMPKCQLSDLPNAISVSPDGSSARLVGSLGMASSLAEIFLLEYAEWPDKPAGWGLVNEKTLGQILPAHTRIFDVVNRAPVVAWANGSALLADMSDALSGKHKDNRFNDAKIVAYVGHDTNIANVSGLLGLTWHVRGYPDNAIPPATALAVELWRKNGQLVVKAKVYSQSMSALHAPFENGQSLAPFAPLEGVVIHESGALETPLDKFMALVKRVTAGAPKVGN